MLFLFEILIVSITYNTVGTKNFTLKAGLYTVECFGAQGGSSYYNEKNTSLGGLGAYVKGTMKVTGKETRFYINVGGQGSSGVTGPNLGGFNGGGSSGQDKFIVSDKDNDGSGGGGGATDIRIGNNSLVSRIMVAAGGSGAAGYCNGAPGGELTGYYPKGNNNFIMAEDVDQNNGNKTGSGSCGIDSYGVPGSGGGGGYMGGLSSGDWSGQKETNWHSVARSGSSYISGFIGCKKHDLMSFTLGQMKKGIKTGNGLIKITTSFTCPSGCSSCNDKKTCTTCLDNFYLINKTCRSKCPTGYYITTSKKCSKCSLNCNTCMVTSSNCASCKKGFYLHKNKCVSECPDGFYGTKSMNCEECHPPCKRCNKTEEDCLSCIENYVLYEGKCVSTCPSNTLKTEKTCEPCQPFCLTCQTTTTNCTSCQEGYNLYNNECISSCPSTTFSTGRECIRCKSPCFTCDTNDDHCTTCEGGFFLYENKCYDVCPKGTKKLGVGCAPSDFD